MTAENEMIKRLVLLPGMDGTGLLFDDFVKALPSSFSATEVRYPSDSILPYSDLMTFLQSAAPAVEPFVLVAESFSTPLAVQYAAMNPPNLKGLVICAGFVSSPAKGWRRFIVSVMAPVLFRLPFPDFAIRFFLVGPNAATLLIAALRAAISSVRPEVLSGRLRDVLACDARAELAQVAVPILYFQGERDRLVHALCLDEMRRIKPEIAVIAIVGPHLILQREPERAADAIAKFMTQLDGDF
jgi:pimeloyl-[acyl-carrier protein] methyl ester esterase